MAKKHQLELKRELGITNLKQIGADPQIRAKVLDYVKGLSPRKRMALIDESPTIALALKSVFAELGDIADSCEKTTRTQWRVFNQIARKKMSSKQVNDAFELLVDADLEKNGRLWDTVQIAVGCAALVAVAGIVGKAFGLKIEKLD